MRWIYRISIALVAFVLVVLGLLFMLPTEKIGQLASDQLERQTGRKLTLSGEFKPTLFPTLGVKTGAMAISNAEWATEPTMISADAVAVGVNLPALLRGALEIDEINLQAPVIYLERAKDGRVNWDVSQTGGSETASPQSDGGSAETPSLELGRITNGRVVFRDHAAATTLDVTNISGTVSLPKGTSTAGVDLSATIDGLSGRVEGTLEDWNALLEGGVSKVDGVFSFADASLKLDGTAGMSGSVPSLDGVFTASVPKPGSIASPLKIALPNQATLLSNLGLSGQIQMSDAGLFIDTKVEGSYAKQAMTGSVMMTGDETWMSNPSFDVSLRAGLAGATAAFDGRLSNGDTPVSGNLQGSATDLRTLLKLAGLNFSAPDGTLRSGKINGGISVAKSGDMVLKNANFTVDQNTVSGTIKMASDSPPFVTANLTAGKLDISDYTADKSPGAGGDAGGATATGWSKDPITLTGLEAVNADVTLKAKGIDLGTTKLGLTDIKAKLRGGKLTLTLRDVRAYQGAMAGTITVRGGKSVSFSSDIKARDVQLELMLGELLDIDRLRGAGNTHMKLSGNGQSIHQMMNSMSGEGDVKFANGSIRGIDLAAMMRNLKSAFGGFEGATEFTSLTGTFSMDQGVLQNVDLSLVSPLFKAGGKGSVDIGGQSMNYLVTPTSLAKDAEFSVPIQITGPWSNLKFRPDVEKLINLLTNSDLEDSEEIKKAKKKLDDLKAKAKDPEDSLKKKLAKELAKKEPAPAEGEPAPQKSLEEVAKDKLEDEIGNALKKLFD